MVKCFADVRQGRKLRSLIFSSHRCVLAALMTAVTLPLEVRVVSAMLACAGITCAVRSDMRATRSRLKIRAVDRRNIAQRLERNPFSMSELTILHQRTGDRAWIESNPGYGMSTSSMNYSARNACTGLILVARFAGSHAAARVIKETAAIAMKIAVGSSGLNS